MMTRRNLVIAAAGATLLVAAMVVGDVLIVTDEERLEDFSDAIAGTIDHGWVTNCLKYVDPARQSVTVEARGSSYSYGREDGGRLTEDAHLRLSPFYGTNLHLMGRTIEVDGDKARVVLHTFSRQGGRATIDLDMKKRGEDWLVAYVKVQ